MKIELSVADLSEYESLQREGIAAMRAGEKEIANDRLAKVCSFFAAIKAETENPADAPRSLFERRK